MELISTVYETFKANGIKFIQDNQVYFDGQIESALSDANLTWEETETSLTIRNNVEELTFRVIPNIIPEDCIIVLY